MSVGLERLNQHYADPQCDAGLKRLREDYERLQEQRVAEFYDHERWLLTRRWDPAARAKIYKQQEQQQQQQQQREESPISIGSGGLSIGDGGGGGAGIERARMPHAEVADRRHHDDDYRIQQLHAQRVQEQNDIVQESRRRLQEHADMRHGQMRRSEYMRRKRQLERDEAMWREGAVGGQQSQVQQQQQRPAAASHFLDFVTWFDVLLLVAIGVYFAAKFGFLPRKK